MVYSHKQLYALDWNKTKLSECLFKEICFKLDFLKYSFKCLLQMQTNSV